MPARRRAPPSLAAATAVREHHLQRRYFLKGAGLSMAAALTGCGRALATAPQEPLAPPPPTGVAEPTLQFATGIENSYPLLPSGRRVDELTKCGHYERWPEDFARLQELRIPALRYGPALFRTHPAPGRFDWSSADDPLAALRAAGTSVIADLCHFGVPDWLSGFDDQAFPTQFAAYAGAFAERYPWIRYYTVINEPYITALFSAYWGWWNEARTGMRAFAGTLVNLARAHDLAVRAILAQTPDAIFIQTESAERYTPADPSTGSISQTSLWNELRYASLDLSLGRALTPAVRALLDLGGLTDEDLPTFAGVPARERRWLGIDYYDTCEQIVHADGHRTLARQRVGLAATARPYFERYRLPLYLTETNEVDSRALEWLGEQWSETLLLRAGGVPVYGFTWYGLTDSVDWAHLLRDERNHEDPIGLTDLSRNLRRVGEAYGTLIARWSPALA